MSQPPLTSQEFSAAVAAAAELESVVGTSLRLCVFRKGWHILSVDDGAVFDTSGAIDLRALENPLVGAARPFWHPISANRSFIGYPIQSTCEHPVYAIAETDSVTDTLLETIRRQSEQLAQLKEDSEYATAHFDGLSDQVLRDFEERSWLVRLSDHLEICELTRDVSDVAAHLLPDLRPLLSAGALAFVPQGSISGSLSSVGRFVSCNGSITLTEESAHRIIRQFQKKAIERPFIRNWSVADGVNELHPDVNTLMLVSVARNTEVSGWLLAVNRQRDEQRKIDLIADPEDPDFQDDEFGTTEAGLLRSAASVLATHHHNLKLFRANQNLTVSAVRSLANAVDARDAYTHGHSERVARMARQLARRSGMAPQLCEQIFMTGLLHDIGKIGVPDSVLLKPGHLTEEEFALIKRHPSTGHQILKHIQELSYTLDGVLYHHEAWNGCGYPKGLQHTEIPLFARILAVVDSYDAMTSKRPYRDGMPFEIAVRFPVFPAVKHKVLRNDLAGGRDRFRPHPLKNEHEFL